MLKTTLAELRDMVLDPKADRFMVGLTLAVLMPDDISRMGFRSLTDLIKHGLLVGSSSPGYTTVMSWVRAHRILDGPDDPRRDLGISVLLEVGKLPVGEQHRYVREKDGDKRPSVRAIRGEANRAKRESARPHAVLERAIRMALEKGDDLPPSHDVHIALSGKQGAQCEISFTGSGLGGTLPAALVTAAEVINAIATTKRAWYRPESSRNDGPIKVSPPMPLEEILQLPAGQLGAHWESPDVACVTKAGIPVLRLPVGRGDRHSTRLLSAQGNTKTHLSVPLIDCIREGCLRAATGWPGSDEACYTVPETNAKGCYAAYSPWACRKHKADGVDLRYDIVRNGLVNPLMAIRLPRNGNPALRKAHGTGIWRVDCESADGAMSVSLGILQSWAEANARHRFFTIASHCFRPSGEMLCWASALRNLWVGHSVSAAFHEAELDVRLASIARFLEYRIPAVVWIVTHEGWDNEAVLRRVLELVPAERVIEAPLRHGTATQELPMLREHGIASCGDHRVADGRSYVVSPRPSPYGGSPETVLLDSFGREASPAGKSSRCLRCSIRCGAACLGSSPRLASHP